MWVRPTEGGKPRKIRLDGIDAPEICQAWGQQSKQALASFLGRGQVTVTVRSRDDYQRLLARVQIKGQDAGEWLVTNGHAWSYQYRHDPGPYRTQEVQAHTAGRGLFAEASAMRPREFRKAHGPCQ